jgi:hypothetical protein
MIQHPSHVVVRQLENPNAHYNQDRRLQQFEYRDQPD